MSEPIKMDVVVGYYVLPDDDYITRDELEQMLSNYPTKAELDEPSIVRWTQNDNQNEEEEE